MPHIRLIGLVLFITAIFLTLAAAVTQTTQIRVKRPSWRTESTVPADGTTTPVDPEQDPTKTQIQFVSIPVIWPLAAAGGLGMLLWFSTAPLQPTKPPRRKRRRRRK